MKPTLKIALVAVLATTAFLMPSCRKETSNPVKAQKTAMVAGSESASYTCDTRCFQEETAWSNGCNYSKSGWAMYTKYNAYGCTPVYAGQNNYAGSASFSCVTDGKVTITIHLTDGWELAPGDESVKIEGYSSAPSGKPAPGKFTYKGNELTIVVCAACYYGIHLDVRKQVACE